MTAPRTTLREVMRRGFFTAPGAFDPFTARAIESLGFPAVYLAGNAMGLHLAAGQPLVTLTETVDCARRVLGAVEAPLIVDAGAGFGGPAHVHRAVREFERAGVAAIHIDDQPYPKQAAYHLGRGALAPLREVLDKLSAAVAARAGDELLVFARCDALKVTGDLEPALERCAAYVRAGVDGLMILNLAPEQVATVRRVLPDTPLAWFATPSQTPPTAGELEAAGFDLALHPFDTAAAVAEAVLKVWGDFGLHGRPGRLADPITQTARRVQELIGMKTYWDIEAQTASHGGETDPSSV